MHKWIMLIALHVVGTLNAQIGNPESHDGMGRHGISSPIKSDASWAREMGRPFSDTIKMAGHFKGGDCGARINAADLELGARAGEIWIVQDCGTAIKSAVSVSHDHVLRFLGGGRYILGAGITLSGARSGIMGPGCAAPDASAILACSVVLQLADGANRNMITTTGGFNSVSGVSLEGNRANNSVGMGIYVNSPRNNLKNLTIRNFPDNALAIISTGINAQANAPISDDVHTAQNGRGGAGAGIGSGLYCFNTNDLMITRSEFESSSSSGALLVGCNSPSISSTDFGGNNAGGIRVSGFSSNILVSGLAGILINDSFGNNVGGHDVFIDGWDFKNRGGSATGWVIVANRFGGFGLSQTRNTYDAIHLKDSYATILGNVITSNGGSYRYGIWSQPVNQPASKSIAGPNYLTGTYGSASTLYGDSDLISGPQDETGVVLQNAYLPNNSYLFARDSYSTNRGILRMDSKNNTIVSGHPGQKTIVLQPDGQTDTCEFSLTSNRCNGKNLILSIGSGTILTSGKAIGSLKSEAEQKITVPGALATDTVNCVLNGPPPPNWMTGITMLPPVLTSNTVTVWLSNPTTFPITPEPALVRCSVTR